MPPIRLRHDRINSLETLVMKDELRKILESNELGAVVELALDNRRVLSHVVRLAYDKDTLLGWRAIKAVGLIAKKLVHQDAEFLREQVLRLLWSLNDESGGIGWAAPELIGEIIAAAPQIFKELIPPLTLAFDAEEATFRPGVVYALERIAEAAPDIAAVYQRIIISSLLDRAALTRVYGLMLIERLWHTAQKAGIWSPEYTSRIKHVIERLGTDKEGAWVYNGTNFDNVIVADYAIDLNKKLN